MSTEVEHCSWLVLQDNLPGKAIERLWHRHPHHQVAKADRAGQVAALPDEDQLHRSGADGLLSERRDQQSWPGQ